jgi:hypothetical protein
MDMLFEAEEGTKAIFSNMVTSGEAHALDELWGDVNDLYKRWQRPIPYHNMLHLALKRFPQYTARNAIELLHDSNMVKHIEAAGPGGRPTFAPIPKKDHNL